MAIRVEIIEGLYAYHSTEVLSEKLGRDTPDDSRIEFKRNLAKNLLFTDFLFINVG